MVLENFRKALDPFLDPIAWGLRGMGPDFFSYLSLIFGIAAGIFYGISGTWVPGGDGQGYPWFLLVALLSTGLTSIFDNLDGRVARMTSSSAVGDFLDHTFDRIADVAILTGIALSPYCHTVFGLFAVIAVLLTSYMGTQAQALGCGRDYTGVMGRADRLVLLLFVTPFQFLLEAGWGIKGWDILSTGHVTTPLEILIAIMLVGGLITALTRGYGTYSTLRTDGCDKEDHGKRLGSVERCLADRRSRGLKDTMKPRSYPRRFRPERQNPP